MLPGTESDFVNRDMNTEKPDRIIVHGARVHNLKNIDVEVPLNGITGIAGVSGVRGRVEKIPGIAVHIYQKEDDTGIQGRSG